MDIRYKDKTEDVTPADDDAIPTQKLVGDVNRHFKLSTLGTYFKNFIGQVTGVIDGLMIASDKTKLDGIETGATADQTGGEMVTAINAEADANILTDAEKTSIGTAEQTANKSVANGYASLDGTGKVPASELPPAGAPGAHAASHTDGTDDIQDATAAQKGLATPTQISKLDGIEAGATANSPDAALLDRANHTGTQTASTISDFDTEVSNNANVSANTVKVGVTSEISNVAEDTTPQAGGDFDMNAHQMQWSKGADLTAAATMTIGTDGNSFDVTGAGSITAFSSVGIGTVISLKFTSVVTMIGGGNLDIPASLSIVTVAGDTAIFRQETASVWTCISYLRNNGDALGVPPNSVSSAEVVNNTLNNADLVQPAGNTVKCNNQAASSDLTDLAMATSTILARLSSGNIVAATVAQILELLGLSKGGVNYMIPADHFDVTDNADWSVNAQAGIGVNDTNNAIKVARFDDTVEEGVGFRIRIPDGATNIIFKTSSYAQTGAADDVVIRIAGREMADAAVVPAWSTDDLDPITMNASGYRVYNSETVAISAFSLTAGEDAQFQLTRLVSDGGDDLVGDWVLESLEISFT